MLRVREIVKSIFHTTHASAATQSREGSCGSYHLPSQGRDSRPGDRAEVEHQLQPGSRGLENLDTQLMRTMSRLPSSMLALKPTVFLAQPRNRKSILGKFKKAFGKISSPVLRRSRCDI